MQGTVVSIMMPAYNAERFIGQAVESTLAQSYPHWELLVVDDGSTDQTSAIIAEYSDRRIKTYHQANGGEASARNTALKHVNGEYLAFLDADDLYLPEHLEVAISFMQTHPEYDGVYTDGYYIDENGQQLKALSSRRRGPFEGDIFEEMVRASDVFGAPVCVVLRSSIVSRYGLDFDPEIVIGPDWDFFIRTAAVAQFGFIRQHTCLYRIHQTNVSIRTGAQDRLLHLARCREKAIKIGRFKECSLQTRAFVFYDLLVNLLTGLPERQSEVTHWPEFIDLPAKERGRLLRLMASKALSRGEDNPVIREWLHTSFRLDPAEINSIVLNLSYSITPRLCRSLIRIRALLSRKESQTSIFGDIN